MIKDDLKNMAKTLILISIILVVILIPRAILTLVYTVFGNEWVFTSLELIDFIYSVFLNSIFFILVTRNDLFSDEFKNFYMRQNSII